MLIIQKITNCIDDIESLVSLKKSFKYSPYLVKACKPCIALAFPIYKKLLMALERCTDTYKNSSAVARQNARPRVTDCSASCIFFICNIIYTSF